MTGWITIYSDEQNTYACPALLGVCDKFFMDIVFLDFVPETIHFTICLALLLKDVMESHNSSVADKRRIHLEILLYALVGMIAVDKH